MKRALVLPALAAWLLIQVPLVCCSTGCGEAVCALFFMDTHACHDEKSDHHHRHCVHRCAEDEPHGTPSEDKEGDHGLVKVQTSFAVVSVLLPAPDVAHASAGNTLALASLLLNRLEDDIWWDPDPPRVPDPVSTADQLLV